MLLMGSVNGLNSPFMKHTDDLFDIRAVCLILAVFHSTAAGMDDLHTHLLKPVQLLEHSLILGRVRIATVAVQESCQSDILIRITGKGFRLFVPGLQAAGTGTGLTGIQAA